MNVVLKLKIIGLFRYLFRRAILRFFYFRVAKSIHKINGQYVTLDLLDLEQRYLAEDCIREPENLIVYKSIAMSKLATSFIDIGANCGHVALSILGNFNEILLIEPNPKLIPILTATFASESSVRLEGCAIVQDDSIRSLDLFVPKNSSGLGSIEGTSFSHMHGDLINYKVMAKTLKNALGSLTLRDSYLKIDVEGFEASIIESSKDLINEFRPIVGFEALSSEAAFNCSKFYIDYVFYCARFNFMEKRGALSRSTLNIIKALLFGASIDVIRLGANDMSEFSNYSQIFSVPKEKSKQFETALNDLWGNEDYINIDTFSRLSLLR